MIDCGVTFLRGETRISNSLSAVGPALFGFLGASLTRCALAGFLEHPGCRYTGLAGVAAIGGGAGGRRSALAAGAGGESGGGSQGGDKGEGDMEGCIAVNSGCCAANSGGGLARKVSTILPLTRLGPS